MSNKLKLDIWGRKFNLDVIMQHFKDEKILDSQKMAMERFEESLDIIGMSQKALEKYILENQDENMQLKAVDNIFKYVMPKYIIIPHTKKRVIAIICDFSFDTEHGLAVIFENEKFKEIGPQDIAL